MEPWNILILCITPCAPHESHLKTVAAAPAVIADKVNFKYDSFGTNTKLFLVGIFKTIVSPNE